MAGSTVLVVVILVVGIGIVALLGRIETPTDTWSRWGSIGETFGVVNSVFSGLALAAVVAACWVQHQELRMQRNELTLQRESLRRSHIELHRSAEASLRMLHFELLRMSIDDPELAAVWPPLAPNLPHERNRQFLYANLIYQHVLLWLRISDSPPARTQNELRYLFTSQIMRQFWQAGATARLSLVEGTPEYEFAQMADRICREYDAVMAGSTPPPRTDPTVVRESTRRWDQLNNGVPSTNV